MTSIYSHKLDWKILNLPRSSHMARDHRAFFVSTLVTCCYCRLLQHQRTCWASLVRLRHWLHAYTEKCPQLGHSLCNLAADYFARRQV